MERPLVLDVGIGMAMVGFVGTLAWCRLIDARARGDQ
jgi:multisubunit Na+/H+ antiporter MnhF subunit